MEQSVVQHVCDYLQGLGYIIRCIANAGLRYLAALNNLIHPTRHTQINPGSYLCS